MDKLSMQFATQEGEHYGDVLEAYERLILDTMRGDATLFARNDEVEAAWAICDPILEAWGKDDAPLPQYTAGSQGPEEANGLLEPGHRWRAI
jgi:glucose-6-phosphate 1-dehydrogenase